MGYQGYKNFETWNIIFWIRNDEPLYNLAKDAGDYGIFLLDAKAQGLIGKETLDGVNWCDISLDFKAINKYISEL